MPFNYRVRRKSVGNAPYTTRPELGTPVSEKELLDFLEKASSITAGDIKNAFTNMRGFLLDAAREGRPTETLFDFFRAGLSCGGALDAADQDVTVEEIAPRMNLYLAGTAQKDFRNNLPINRAGIDHERLPEIDIVKDDLTEIENLYTPGDAIMILGDDLKFDKGDDQQGVFIKPPTTAALKSGAIATSM